MSDTVPAVVCEGVGREGLERDLGEDGQAGETGCQSRALEVPAERGGDQVRGAKGVDTDGQCRARDSVEHGHVPCYLGAVDGQVRRHGSVEALGGEDLFTGRRGDAGCCCCLSGKDVVG